MAKNFQVMTAAELSKHPGSDKGYRKGFLQGYSAAAAAVLLLTEGGYSRPREIYSFLFDFANGEITRWLRNAEVFEPPVLKQTPWWVLRQRILSRDGHECQICGLREDLQVDHIRPVSEYGKAEVDNLRVLCRKCNMRRNSKGAD